ncbi:MAG: FtsW/RodA/SpoVE family cell cycle protein [Armatimonadetes bacterium]|nr:FtsW/RodA/SpoVE family cell cycle protein [Armatimonadota bacterium]
MRPRSVEIAGICAAGVISWLGMAHACLARDASLVHAARAAAPAAFMVLAALLMDAFAPQRDRLLLPPVALLAGIGVALLWRIDGYLAAKQVMWVLVGTLAMAATYLTVADVRALSSVASLSGIVAALLLVVTMLWGEERHGARLWLGIPGVAMFQPGEVAKLLLVLSLAGWLADYQPASRLTAKQYALLAGLLGLLVLSLGMFVLQRDMGAAALIFGTALLVVYVATGASPLLAALAFLFGAGLVVALWLLPGLNAHAAAVLERRILAWVNPWASPFDAGYQALQGLVSIAHGSLLGCGLGLGLPDAMPVAESDMIYAVAAEDLGFCGSAAILLLYALIAWRGFQLALAARDRFSSLLAAGLSTLLALQSLIIVAGVIRVLPLTGITLPLLSYGGSSMVSTFVAVGLLLCVSRDAVSWPPEGRRR